MAATSTIEKTYCPECGEEFDAGVRQCPNDGSRLFSYQVRDDSTDRLIGETIDGRFRIDEVLGEGGMGRVYRGVQLSVERSVAIKVLRPELIDREEVIQRFLREARVISGFSHPNIVNLVDFGQDPTHDVLYLVMELIDGLPLGDVMIHGRAHPNLACEVAIQVSRALAEAHSRKIIHRDLKPDNLMLVPMSDGSVQVKVLDFGIARAVQGEKKLTSTGQVFGTAHYMAPEQASGHDVVPQTDGYALGCILYEMLCGKLPFDAPSVMGLLVSHVQKEPPSLSSRLVDSDVPDDLVSLVMQLLEKSPKDRPRSVLEVRDRVEKIRSNAAFGPLRVPTGQPLDLNLFRRWLRANGGKLNESSDALNRSTGDHSRSTAENEALATAETAAHQSAPSLDAPDTGDADSRDTRRHDDEQTREVAASDLPTAPGLESSEKRRDPRPSEPSVELELERVRENKRLQFLTAGLIVIVLLAGGVALVLVSNMNSVAAVAGENDAGTETNTPTIAAEPTTTAEAPVVPTLAEPDAGEADGAVADSAEPPAIEPVETPPVEKKPVEKKPVEKKPVEKKPVEKKPVEKKPVEKKPVEKKLETITLPM